MRRINRHLVLSVVIALLSVLVLMTRTVNSSPDTITLGEGQLTQAVQGRADSNQPSLHTSRLWHAPAIDDFSSEEWLLSVAPNIEACLITVGEQVTGFPHFVEEIAEKSGVNARILLTLTDIEQGYLFHANPEDLCEALTSYANDLSNMAQNISEAAYAFHFGKFDDDSRFTPYANQRKNENIGEASFAIAEVVAIVATRIGQNPTTVEDLFYSRYANHFGDPSSRADYYEAWLRNMRSRDLNTVGTMEWYLPYYGNGYFTGGPHGGSVTKGCTELSTDLLSGIDFVANEDDVLAVTAGTIVGIRQELTAPGKWVAIEHDGDYKIVSMYWHLDSIYSGLRVGMKVNAGAYLGKMGNTGCDSCGKHIHLELRTGGTTYDSWVTSGVPVSWGEIGAWMSGWKVSPVFAKAGTGYNYEGTAVDREGWYEIKSIEGACGNSNAVVERLYSSTLQTNTSHTKFANNAHTAVLIGDVGAYCPAGTGRIAAATDTCGDPLNDTTPPNSEWLTPQNYSSIRSQTVGLRSSASDDSSGVNRVSFSAKYGGSWHSVFTDYSYPYEYEWDLCAAGVPDGDVELGLEVWDNAGNHFVHSESGNANFHITKSYDCGSSGPPPPTERVHLYDHTNYEGEVGNYGTGFTNDPNANSFSMHVPSGWSVITYSQNNSESRCWSGSVSNLQDHSWHLKIQSMDVYDHEVCPEPAPPAVTWEAKFWPTGTCYDDHNQCTDSNTTHRTNYDVPGNVNGRQYIIKQDWGQNSPGDSTPKDEFTGYFRATLNFASGNYVFYSTNDDGLKFKIPGYGEYSTGRDNREENQQMCNGDGQTYYLDGSRTLEAWLHEAGGDATIQIWYDNNTDACIPPTLFWPSDGSSFANDLPSFDWESKSWGPQYTIAVDGIEYTTSSSDFTPPGPLGYGTHSWRIRARNPYGGTDSPWSDTWQFTVQPPAPANVVATDGSYTNTIQVSWDTVAGMSGYEVYRATSSEGAKTKLATVSTTSFNDITAPIGIAYYWIKACVDTACGSYSNYDTGYLARPSNDNFYTPQVLFSVPYTDTRSTINATTEVDDPTLSCASGQQYSSVWYRYIALEDGTLSVNTYGSNYDTILAIWNGTRGNLQSVGCNDDADHAIQSRLDILIDAGTVYYIEVTGYESSSYGTLRLSASFTPTLTPTPTATPTPTFTATSTSMPTLPGSEPPAGNSLDLNGTSAYASVVETSMFDGLTTLSVEGWIKTSKQSGAQAILSKYRHNTEGNLDDSFFLGVTNGHVVWQLNAGDSWSGLDGTINVADGAWHHLAGTWDGNTQSIYVDGELDVQRVYSGNGQINATSHPILIGRSIEFGQAAQYFAGQLDEIRIWQRVLSGQEIQHNRAGFLLGNEGGLLAYWRMDESTQSSLVSDQTSYGNTAYLLDGAKLVAVVGSTPTPSSTPTNSPTPTNTPTATSTSTATPTSTSTPTSIVEQHTVSGSVFEDRNDNGQRDTDEFGVANAEVHLRDTQRSTMQEWIAVTDAEGDYSFEQIPRGSYQLGIKLPDQYMDAETYWQDINVSQGMTSPVYAAPPVPIRLFLPFTQR